MRRNILITSIAIVVLAAWLVTSHTRAQQSAENPNDAKIRVLLRQRHDVLQQRYETIKRLNEDGDIPKEQVISALDDLLKARLELTASRQERIDICSQRVANLRSLEQLFEARLKVGDGQIGDQMLAAAARIQAEIDWRREEMRSH